MEIGVVGLGLMGGSIARALTEKGYTVVGEDICPKVVQAAMEAGAIQRAGSARPCEVVFVCLYPEDAVCYMLEGGFATGALVTDIGGVKRYVVDQVAKKLWACGVHFVGGHPMAGKEVGGFENSRADLLVGASYIIAKDEYTDDTAAEQLARLALQMGCGRITYTTPDQHDYMIAYTSQLAHVVSSCYIKNPAAQRKGFSAGSFLDLTRVAQLDADMWAQLFMKNSDYLLEHMDQIQEQMDQMKTALQNRDGQELARLLKEGSELKKQSLQNK